MVKAKLTMERNILAQKSDAGYKTKKAKQTIRDLRER